MKKIFSLENLIYLAILSLPLYLLRFGIFGLPTNVWEVMAVGIILIWIRRLAVETPQRGVSTGAARRFYGAVEKKYLVPITLTFSGLLLSIAVNGSFAAGFGIIKSWFLVPLFFSLAAWDVLPREKWKNIFWTLYVSSFCVSLISLGYYFLGSVTYDGRLQGFFNSPNYLAMFLAPGMIAGSGFFLLRSELRNKERFFLALFFPVMLFSFYKTYSYAAWLSLAAAVFLLAFFTGKIKIKHVLLAVAVLASVLFLQRDSEKFRGFISLSERSSLSSRVMIWRSAGKMLSENFAVGIGPGNFQDKYLEYQKYYPPYLEWAAPHPHNVYLAFWLYGGILGIVGFLWLVYLFLKDFFGKTGCVETPRRGVSIIACVSFGIIVYFLLHGLFDTTYFKNDLAVVFWLAYGGGVANKKFAGKN